MQAANAEGGSVGLGDLDRGGRSSIAVLIGPDVEQL